MLQLLHLFELPQTLHLQDKQVPGSNGEHLDSTCGNLGIIEGTSMASHGFIGCVLALEVIYVIIQMVELLDTAVNIAT